jgi:hypothetical protein
MYLRILTLTIPILLLYGGMNAQSMALEAKYTTRQDSSELDWLLGYLFEESDLFSYGSSFLWVDYQPLSNLGERPDRTGTLIPPSGIHYEQHLFSNLGMRLDANLNVWEEEKPLVRSGDILYTEPFEYRYWTVSIGGNWHIKANEFWDPYIGFVASYRQSRAFCDCVDESRSMTSYDFLIGTRVFLVGGSFFVLEVGQHGVGFVSGGLGLQF